MTDPYSVVWAPVVTLLPGDKLFSLTNQRVKQQKSAFHTFNG